MSSHNLLLNSSKDSEVMVRQSQVNCLAAAFHDHISCTKISQQSIASNICLESVSEMTQTMPNQTSVASMPSVVESDHLYATESKNSNHSNNSDINSNGIIGNNSFHNNVSDERNQIQKLTEMILAQLDLIQHQQEQLLKKDRQLQGLKQDREALCLRLQKMEKRIAVLTTKVANSSNSGNTCNTINTLNSNSLNTNRNVANSNNSSIITTETDCDQSGSDTIIEDNNSAINLLSDTTVFYTQTSSVNTCNINISNSNSNNSNNSNSIDKKTNITTANPITTVRIKSEPQDPIDCSESTTTTTTISSTSVRKNRKRHPEVISTPNTSTTPSNKKRSKACLTNSDMNAIDIKKESTNFKETSSCDSLSTSQSCRTYSNKKKAIKQKSETSKIDSISTNTLSNYKTNSLTKDILTTSKPYSIIFSRNESTLELCAVNVNNVNNTNTTNTSNTIINTKNKVTDNSLNKSNCVEEKSSSNSSNSDNIEVIEVPNWRLHPVSSCYSLEGTENLDDEVFNRRHSKLEIDERRRKRWDIQRLREQRHNEKLRTGRYYSGSLANLGNCFIEKPSDLKRKSCEFTSFFPDVKNVQSIEVTEKIPVIAFGHSIPRLPSKCFSLPWNISQTSAKTRNSPQKKH